MFTFPQVSEVIGTFSGIHEANVFGVELPNTDGRIGMAALVLSEESHGDIDLSGLYRHVLSLPSYARPAFLRILAQGFPPMT